MNLIIESGSTKADWLLYTHDGYRQLYTTHGINPTTMIDLSVIQLEAALIESLTQVTHIYYYGAGVNSAKTTERVQNYLKSKCPSIKQLEVAEDCLAAARACFGHQAGIIGILGTGSNSAYYDGTQVDNLQHTLGFIISDEGGGTYIGKEILRAYFYDQMPTEVRTYMESHYETNKTKIQYQLYRSTATNRFLASYASLLTEVNTPWTAALVKKCIRKFFEIRVLPFYKDNTLPLSFVGSIAYYHSDIVQTLCNEYGILFGEILHKPLDRLLDYHLSLSQS